MAMRGFARIQLSKPVSAGLSDSKESIEEDFKLIYYGLFFLCSCTITAESGNWRHQLVNIGSGGLDFSVAESVIQKFSGFRFPELFLLDYLF